MEKENFNDSYKSKLFKIKIKNRLVSGVTIDENELFIKQFYNTSKARAMMNDIYRVIGVEY